MTIEPNRAILAANHAGGVRRTASRGLAMLGTALGSTLVVMAPAHAQNVTSLGGTTPYTLTETGTRSGGPRTIDVSTSTGDINIDVGTINSTNNTNATGAGIGAAQTGTGNVSIRDANITSTGTGPSNGIDASTANGSITITNTGVITSNSSANSRGIAAVGNGGTITITSNEANGSLRGIATSGNSSLTTINSTTATASGTNTINAILGQGERVVITSGTATNTNAAGNSGTAIFANTGTGGALVNAGTTTALGQNQAALQVFSQGTVDVTSGTIRTTQNSDGLSIQSGTTVVVRSTTVNNEGTNSGYGIVLGANRGGGGFNGGANGFAYTSADITSGAVTTAGANAYGIYATPNGAGTTTITSNNVTTTGQGSHGINVGAIGSGTLTGSATVNSTGLIQTSGNSASGIMLATKDSGALTANNTGQIKTAGTSAYGINVTAGSGAAIVTGTGSITTTGANAHGIFFNPAANVNTGAIAITAGPITTSGANSQGIFVVNAGGPVAINASDVRTTGTGAAIVVQQTAGSTAAINVQAGTIRSGSAGAAINLSSNGTTGPLTASVADSISVGAAIDARSVGAVTVSGGTVQTTGANATGLVAISTGGLATVNSTNLTSANRGIYAQGLDNVTVNSGTLVSSNADFGLLAVTANAGNPTAPVVGTAEGVINVTSGNLTATNGGINAFGPRATVNVNSGTVTVGNADAIQAFGIDVNVTSDTINTGSGGINAGMGTGATRRGATTINSGTINLTGAVAGAGATGAITANGASVLVNSTTITNTGLGNRFGIFAQVPQVVGTTNPPNAGTVTINSGSITTVGDGAYGVQAVGDAGKVTVNSTGTITTVGGARQAGNQLRFSAGIVANTQSGAIEINSNNITTGGTQADGVRVEQGSGNVNFNQQASIAPATIAITTSGLTQTNGPNSAGINVLAGGGTVTINNTGTIQTAAGGSTGIVVQSPGAGGVTVASNAITTGGTSSSGIQVNSDTGAIGINATSITTTGAESAAVRAQSNGGAVTVQTGTVSTAFSSPGIVATSTNGAVSITAANTTSASAAASGGISVFGVNAIAGTSTNGAVTINAGTVNASNGTGVNAMAGTAAAVTVTGSSNATGDDSAGVRATGGTGVTLNVANATSTGGSVNGRADAIFAEALTGTVNATVGSASAQGANSDAVHLVANGTGGAVTLNVTGNVTSAGGYGVFIDPPGNVNVTVASGATLSGALGGLDTASDAGVNTVVNAGTIRGTAGAGIIALGTTALDNRGTLAGSGGVAVQLGASNDTVTLRTGSVVTGAIAGGGTDSATLIGTGTAPVATQTVAAFQGFDSVTVQSGYWTAPAANASTVARTIIASGAALEVANGTAGIAGFQSGTYADNGSLVVRSSATSAGSTFGAATVTGTGGVTFTGPGTATLGGTNSLTNTGTNTVDTGSTVLVTGTQGGTFVNNGTFTIGTGGTTGNFTGNLADNGTLIINRSDLYNFTGALTGAGTFVKQGAGQVVFGAGYAFTGTTQLNGGSIKLTTPVAANTELDVQGTGTVDLSGQTNTVAELMGGTGGTVNIANGALTVNQTTSTTFAGMLVGAGSLSKTGTGTLNLTGANTYTGPTTVSGGTLAVNGSVTSPITVTSGGSLGGTGTITGNVSIGSGGRYTPGNSIGTQTINGNVAFAAGSTYAVEANAAGQSDKIVASGTANISGGTVAVTAAAGTYNQLTNYVILTAAGGVTGRFTTVTSNLAFLSPLLSYSTTAVNLTLARNDIAFGAMAVTSNQLAVANAIAGRTVGDAVFNAILFQPNTSAAASFDQLSGEIHASVPSVLVDGGRRVRDAVLDRGTAKDEGVGLWATGIQTFARTRNQGGFAQARTNRTGVYGGVDYGASDFRYGVSGGYFDQKIRIPGRASTADVDTKLVGASVAYTPAGSFSVQGGLTYAWHDIDAVRGVTVAGLPGTFTSSYDAHSVEAFAEAGYSLTNGPVSVVPFARYTHDWTKTDGFTESAGSAGLTFGSDRRDANFAAAGLRIGGAAPVGANLTIEPKAAVSYEHGWGDLSDARGAAFATGTGPAFAVSGVKLGRNTIDADLGADLVTKSGLRIGAAGFASHSKEWRDYGGKVTLGFRF